MFMIKKKTFLIVFLSVISIFVLSAEDEVRGTLTREWKYADTENLVKWQVTGQGVGYDEKFYIQDFDAKQVVEYDSNGPTGVTYASGQGNNLGIDEGGNLIVRLGRYGRNYQFSTPEFRVIKLSDGSTYDVTLPEGSVDGAADMLGRITGDVFGIDGASLYLSTNSETEGIVKFVLKAGDNGIDVTADRFSVDGLQMVNLKDKVVSPWTDTKGIEHLMYSVRSENPVDLVAYDGINYTMATYAMKNVAGVDKSTSSGAYPFTLAGHNFMLIPILPAWLDGFAVVKLNDDYSATTIIYHENEFPRTTSQYDFEEVNANWLNIEPIDKVSCRVYQYFPGGYISTYIFKVTSGSASGVNDIATHNEPVEVVYYNLAGMRSNVPFNGVNIVVSRYADGSTTTGKVMH